MAQESWSLMKMYYSVRRYHRAWAIKYLWRPFSIISQVPVLTACSSLLRELGQKAEDCSKSNFKTKIQNQVDMLQLLFSEVCNTLTCHKERQAVEIISSQSCNAEKTKRECWLGFCLCSVLVVRLRDGDWWWFISRKASEPYQWTFITLDYQGQRIFQDDTEKRNRDSLGYLCWSQAMDHKSSCENY